ncbi:MAG: AAA family ATPase [Candidatus Caldarchaeum sp.]
MITGLELKGFRGIRETAEPIPLKKFNVLVGRNNSGKTAVLEALALLPRPDATLPMTSFSRLNFIISQHNSRTDSLVYGYAGQATLTFQGDEANAKYEIDTQTKLVQHVITDSIFESRNVSCYTSPDVYRFIQNELVRENTWKALEKTRAHNYVVRDVINPAVSDKFTEIIPQFLQKEGIWILQARKEFPDGTSAYIRLSEIGAGVQRVIVPLLWFEAAKPSIVLWDDIEASMHPSLLENVLRWLASKDWQIVISTHSIDVLHTLTDVGPKHMQVITLSKTPDDILMRRTLTLDELQTFIEHGTDPRRLADLLLLK